MTQPILNLIILIILVPVRRDTHTSTESCEPNPDAEKFGVWHKHRLALEYETSWFYQDTPYIAISGLGILKTITLPCLVHGRDERRI